MAETTDPTAKATSNQRSASTRKRRAHHAATTSITTAIACGITSHSLGSTSPANNAPTSRTNPTNGQSTLASPEPSTGHLPNSVAAIACQPTKTRPGSTHARSTDAGEVRRRAIDQSRNAANAATTYVACSWASTATAHTGAANHRRRSPTAAIPNNSAAAITISFRSRARLITNPVDAAGSTPHHAASPARRAMLAAAPASTPRASTFTTTSDQATSPADPSDTAHAESG